MKTLKQKALHYQKGGKYLAQKEEDDYICGVIATMYRQWQSDKKLRESWCLFDNYIGLQIGLWQAGIGFTRAHSIQGKTLRSGKTRRKTS
jgi:hypothetical protein